MSVVVETFVVSKKMEKRGCVCVYPGYETGHTIDINSLLVVF